MPATPAGIVAKPVTLLGKGEGPSGKAAAIPEKPAGMPGKAVVAALTGEAVAATGEIPTGEASAVQKSRPASRERPEPCRKKPPDRGDGWCRGGKERRRDGDR